MPLIRAWGSPLGIPIGHHDSLTPALIKLPPSAATAAQRKFIFAKTTPRKKTFCSFHAVFAGAGSSQYLQHGQPAFSRSWRSRSFIRLNRFSVWTHDKRKVASSKKFLISCQETLLVISLFLRLSNPLLFFRKSGSKKGLGGYFIDYQTAFLIFNYFAAAVFSGHGGGGAGLRRAGRANDLSAPSVPIRARRLPVRCGSAGLSSRRRLISSADSGHARCGVRGDRRFNAWGLTLFCGTTACAPAGNPLCSICCRAAKHF